jgi:hypothetical protein
MLQIATCNCWTIYVMLSYRHYYVALHHGLCEDIDDIYICIYIYIHTYMHVYTLCETLPEISLCETFLTYIDIYIYI